MKKKEYVIRQLSKTNKKNYENYVISRMWHLLDREDIKIVTQQHVTLPGGKRALTDLYFPQLGLHLEVDEEHHFERKAIESEDIKQKQTDQDRAADIINATGHELVRIDVRKDRTLQEIHEDIDKVVEIILEEVGRLEKEKTFRSWDIEAEQNPRTYIDRGFMHVDDDVAFETIALACNCFGRSYPMSERLNGWQIHPIEENTRIWFPRLYPNDDWVNALSPDEETITERPEDGGKNAEHMERTRKNLGHFCRIVFARVKGPLGEVLYRFKGAYKYDPEASNAEGQNIFKRIHTEVKTYKTLTQQFQGHQA